MSHFLFEYVHPFYDGNGRTGRYLLALYLNHDLTMPTVLSLSRTIAENKNAYYKAFMEAEDKLNCGELTLFVNTILGFIQQAQDELIDELSIKVDLHANDSSKVVFSYSSAVRQPLHNNATYGRCNEFHLPVSCALRDQELLDVHFGRILHPA